LQSNDKGGITDFKTTWDFMRLQKNFIDFTRLQSWSLRCFPLIKRFFKHFVKRFLDSCTFSKRWIEYFSICDLIINFIKYSRASLNSLILHHNLEQTLIVTIAHQSITRCNAVRAVAALHMKAPIFSATQFPVRKCGKCWRCSWDAS
jgi:hypothetical protein